MTPAYTVIAAAAGVLVAAYVTRQAANVAAGESASTVLDFVNPWGTAETLFDQHQVTQAMLSANVRAFLALLAVSEGTASQPDPYRVCYGYRHTIADLSEHPAIAGEWHGESLDNLGPAYAGQVSTAAGRYQINRPTWDDARRALRLPDFRPSSQDAAACWLIRRAGAMTAVQEGRLADAIAQCSGTWASLPGSSYGQPTARVGALVAAYQRAGGQIA